MPMNSIITQVYYTDKERVEQYTFHGWGDFIRGCIYMFQYCKNNNIELKIDFSKHYISKFFICNSNISIDDCKNAKYIFADNEYDNIADYPFVFTNRHPPEAIDEPCKRFIKTNCFTPVEPFYEKVASVKKSFGLVNAGYYVLHVRLADNEIVSLERIKQIDTQINAMFKEHCFLTNQKILLISSNEDFLNKYENQNLIKTGLSRGHLGLDTTGSQQTEDTMIEFILLTTCKEIIQFSVYCWGSGFSDIVSKIYDINIKQYSL
jgi:hypothetical protein